MVTQLEKYGAVNLLTLSRSADSDIIYYPDVIPENPCEIKIVDNQIMNFNDRDTYMPDIYSKIQGLEYYINDFNSIGILYYDLYDIYNVKIGEQTYKCIMLNNEINVTSGLEEIIHTEMPEEAETDYTKADKTDRRINQTYLIVNKQEQEIKSLIKQIGNRSEKTTTITQDIDGIQSIVEDYEDLTREAKGIHSVTINDAYPNEDILELHIYGNNSVFDYLYPEDDLYPNDTLYPYGDSRIRFYNDEEDITIELGIEEVLRANTQVKDEVFIDYQGNVSVIRRVNSDGTTKATPVTTVLGQLHFKLIEGNNIFEIVNYNAPIEVKYAIKSTYTDIFATKVEMNSSINQTAEAINLRVSKKVDETEVVSVINQSAEEIELKGNRVIIESTNFKLDKDGNIKAKNGEFSGDITIGVYDHLIVYDTNGKKMIQIENNGIALFDSNGVQSNTISRTTTGNNQGMTFKTHSIGSYVGIANGNDSKFVYNSDTDKIDVYTQVDMHETTLRNVKDPIFNIYTNATEYYWGYPVIGYRDEHKYMMDWTGSQLEFYVDGINVGTLSDERLKTEIQDVDEKFVDIIEEIELKQFKIANRNGLTSFGIIAQDLIKIFKKYNKNPFDYEIVTKTKYRMDDNTEFYTINYEQFLILKQKALNRKIKMLEENDKNKEIVINNLIKRIQRLEEK